MSIADAVTRRQLEIAQERKCKFFRVFMLLDNEDRQAVQYVVDLIQQGSKDFPIAWLHDTLVKNGHDLGKTAVSTHLAGKCACDRS